MGYRRAVLTWAHEGGVQVVQVLAAKGVTRRGPICITHPTRIVGHQQTGPIAGVATWCGGAANSGVLLAYGERGA